MAVILGVSESRWEEDSAPSPVRPDDFTKVCNMIQNQKFEAGCSHGTRSNEVLSVRFIGLRLFPALAGTECW